MRLYLIRHGIAAERSDFKGPDSQRPLTTKGGARMERVARGLSRLVPRSALLVTSPARRAKETAAIVHKKVGVVARTRTSKSLAPGASPTSTMRMLFSLKSFKHVVFIGHEPNLSAIASRLLGNDDRSPHLEIKKGGLCVVELTFPAAGPPIGKLLLHLTPKVLRLIESR
jgi:phosphohistidine phosphatase